MVVRGAELGEAQGNLKVPILHLPPVEKPFKRNEREERYEQVIK